MYCNCASAFYNNCNPCRYFSTIGTSVSRWCSSGVPDAAYADFAFLTQTGSLSVAAGESIPFSGASMVTGAFSYANGLLNISRAGIYRLTYTVNLPEGTALEAGQTFYVLAGNTVLAGTTLTAQTGGTLTAQAIFEVTSSIALSLVSSGALNVTAAGDAVIASMVVEKLV